MAKVSPRIDVDFKEMAIGTDDGRNRQNVFNAKLFTDNYANDLYCEEKSSVYDFKERDMLSQSVFQSGAVNDLVAKKVSPQLDRFSRSLDAIALAEIADTTSLPFSIGICAQK